MYYNIYKNLKNNNVVIHFARPVSSGVNVLYNLFDEQMSNNMNSSVVCTLHLTPWFCCFAVSKYNIFQYVHSKSLLYNALMLLCNFKILHRNVFDLRKNLWGSHNGLLLLCRIEIQHEHV